MSAECCYVKLYLFLDLVYYHVFEANKPRNIDEAKKIFLKLVNDFKDYVLNGISSHLDDFYSCLR